MECVFTIVAKNYIGLAQILKKSFARYNDVPFYIIVADELDEINISEEIFEAKNILDIEENVWYEMAFKYDLTEFCTSIKPYCFKYLLSKFDKVVYLDPDILFFGNLSKVLHLLSEYDMVLTPHISECHVKYGGDLKENQLLGSGVFNLGFCGVKKSLQMETIIDWWAERLKSMCFSDPLEYLYTDQHWMDMIPCFLGDKLFVLRDLGYNMAPWNYFERKVLKDGNNYYIISRSQKTKEQHPLIFVHYSGYDYKTIISGKCVQRNIRIMDQYEDILLILDAYKKELLNSVDLFNKYINLKYTYNYFVDDKLTQILPFHRRLYNGLLKKGVIGSNPFINGSNSFFYLLKKSHLLPQKETSVDKETVYSLKGIERKYLFVNKLLNVAFKLFGYEKYVLFIKAMRVYSRNENHIFLIKN